MIAVYCENRKIHTLCGQDEFYYCFAVNADVRLKDKQNWINHLERMDNTRLPKHALNYKPRGRRDRGRPWKRWQCLDAGTGQTT